MGLSLIGNRLLLICCLCCLVGCNKLEDDSHYKNSETRIDNAELSIVDMPTKQFLASRSDLQKMTAFLTEHDVFTRLEEKGQLHTLLVVGDDNFSLPEKDAEYIANSHVSDIAMSPANLSDGERIMMWHGKYVNVAIDSVGLTGTIIDHIKMNTSVVKEVVKTTDGYVYVIDKMIETPTSLYDYIQELPDEYSIFREMVINSGSKEFDKANSKAIGINEQGNTIYDSVFVYKSTFFSSKGLDLNSESITATMLLFSDKVINDALEVAKKKLDLWELDRSSDTLRKWVLKAAFFSKKYSSAEIQTTEETDLMSIYDCQWRTNIQKVDAQNPVELSNGVVYKVTELTFPLNVLIYRLKDWYYYYENCTDEEKATYFANQFLVFNSCATDVAPWSPMPGVWPNHQDRVLVYGFDKNSAASDGFQLTFTPLKKITEEGVSHVRPYLVPPGQYRLAMGFVQSAGLDVSVEVLVEGSVIAKSSVITLGSATTYHYDRGATLKNTYPEGYDPDEVSAKQMGDNYKKAANYDTDGGPIIDVVDIPDLDGKGTPHQIQIRLTNTDRKDKTKFTFCHWCLRPTSNNY